MAESPVDSENESEKALSDGEPDERRIALVREDDEDVDLAHARMDEIRGLDELKCVKTLSLRQNRIKKIEKLDTLTTLEDLSLYDNLLTSIENLDNLTNLTSLDVSFNKTKKIQNIDHLVKLKKLYLIRNRITKIENIAPLINLTMLELGSNRIRKIDCLETLVNLEELYLGQNKITKLENLDKLSKLRMLSIQSNRIVKLEGLDSLLELEDLYLSNNGIEKIENLTNNNINSTSKVFMIDPRFMGFEEESSFFFKKLSTFDIGSNRVKVIEGVDHLHELLEFWCNDNQVAAWKDLDTLSGLKKLETVYLERNPLQSQDQTAYRRKVLLALPKLKQLDATMTNR